MKNAILLVVSHVCVLAAGLALGLYALPILTAPIAPSLAVPSSATRQTICNVVSRRDLKVSTHLHWGQGTVNVGSKSIAFTGKLAPGPDYKLYLSPEFVETEKDFARLKPQMKRIGDVRTFENFVVPVPESIDVSQYKAVIVWCESFSQFITAAEYR